MTEPIIELRSVSEAFGGVVANKDVISYVNGLPDNLFGLPTGKEEASAA